MHTYYVGFLSCVYLIAVKARSKKRKYWGDGMDGGAAVANVIQATVAAPVKATVTIADVDASMTFPTSVCWFIV